MYKIVQGRESYLVARMNYRSWVLET